MSSSFKRPLLAVLISSFVFQMSAGLAAEQLPSNVSDPCATNQGQVAGAVIGALLGGFLGNKVGNGKGRKLATAAGALGGLAIGNYIGSELDRRKCEVTKIAQKNNLTISVTDIALPANPDDNSQSGSRSGNAEKVGMSVSIEDRPDGQTISDASGGDSLGNAGLSTQFRSGSDALSPEAEGYFREIAAQYALAFNSTSVPQGTGAEQVKAAQGLRQKRILIVGHTDDTGSSRLNADLSEQRARNVGRVFAEAGVPSAQVFYQGSGETQPIADNRSESGRARNRRVEIIDLPDEGAFQKFLSSRVANASFYRTAAPGSQPALAKVETPAKEAAPESDKTRTSTRAASRTPSISSSAAAVSQTKAVAANVTAPSHPLAHALAAGGYDFGGTPAAQKLVTIDIGRPLASTAGFSIISTARADDMPMDRSCTDDRPRYANAVKDLEGNREYHVSEYLPNLYDTSWADTVNGNLVALTHVAVLRDGAAPARNPTVLIYKAAHGKPTSGSKADFNTTAHVNTYQGERGLLYRVFVDGPIKCMDVVLQRDQSYQAVNSNIYYQAGTTKMVAAYNPKIAK